MEPLTVEYELGNLVWAVQALAELGREPGSYERENARNAARGIVSRLEWCLERVREGAGSAGVAKRKE